MNETRLQVLKEADRNPKSRSYLMVKQDDPPDLIVVLYDFDPSGSRQALFRLFDDLDRYVQNDSYEGYNSGCT